MIHRHIVSIGHALNGLWYTLVSEPNFIVHLILSSGVVFAGFWFSVSPVEWLVLVLTITVGLVIELINTAIEAVVDLVTDQYHHHAKIAKDVAAAAMLIYSIGAVLVALIIFLPKFP